MIVLAYYRSCFQVFSVARYKASISVGTILLTHPISFISTSFKMKIWVRARAMTLHVCLHQDKAEKMTW